MDGPKHPRGILSPMHYRAKPALTLALFASGDQKIAVAVEFCPDMHVMKLLRWNE